jgi:hypothetical protein
MRILAFITEAAVIDRILAHRRRSARGRGPPPDHRPAARPGEARPHADGLLSSGQTTFQIPIRCENLADEQPDIRQIRQTLESTLQHRGRCRQLRSLLSHRCARPDSSCVACSAG